MEGGKFVTIHDHRQMRWRSWSLAIIAPFDG